MLFANVTCLSLYICVSFLTVFQGLHLVYCIYCDNVPKGGVLCTIAPCHLRNNRIDSYEIVRESRIPIKSFTCFSFIHRIKGGLKYSRTLSSLDESRSTDESNEGLTTHELGELVSRELQDTEEASAVDRHQRFPDAAKALVHAPRYINKRVRTRYKYSPIAKSQGLPNDDTKSHHYRFSKHLHICGGAIRGRRLCVPPVYLRPMMNRVKDALFASLQHMGVFAYGHECRVIDLFCGSGSVGLEALSYGATHCTFVDVSIQCCKATSLNALHCNFEDKVRVVRADAIESITSPWLHSITDTFDLLFACPPYEEIVYMDLMKQIANTTLLKPNSVVVVEYPREIAYLPWNIEDGKLLGYRNRKYGRTVVAIYCYKPKGTLLEACNNAQKEFVPTTYVRKRLKIEGFIAKESPDAPAII